MKVKKRKVVQIAVSPPDDKHNETVYALCSDGTLWWTYNEPGCGWRQFADDLPPSDEEK